MKSAGGLAIGLVVSLLVFAFVAELSYLLWWKKKRISSIRRRHAEEEDLENGGQDDYAAATAVTGKYNAKELFHLICWKNPSTVIAKPDSEHGGGGGGVEEESVELELMRLHNLAGPPRFLFTTKEETKEDLVDSEDGRSRVGEFSSRRLSLSRSKSLSEIEGEDLVRLRDFGAEEDGEVWEFRLGGGGGGGWTWEEGGGRGQDEGLGGGHYHLRYGGL